MSLHSQLLEEENETLRNEMSLLQETLDQKETLHRESETKHRTVTMKLASDNQGLSRQLRELKADIVGLQAREPEVGGIEIYIHKIGRKCPYLASIEIL